MQRENINYPKASLKVIGWKERVDKRELILARNLADYQKLMYTFIFILSKFYMLQPKFKSFPEHLSKWSFLN